MVTKQNSSASVTCPFCSLLCDDLSGRQRSNPGADICPRAERGFEQRARNDTARIGGEPGDLDAALAAAATLVRRSKRPLLAGLTTDVAGMRSVLDLARRVRAFVDPVSSPAQLGAISVLQRQGMMTTTFSEVRNRADCIVVLGDDLFEDFPRFAERCLGAARSVDGSDLRRRRIIVVGPRSVADPALDGHDVTCLPFRPRDVPQLVNALRARLRGAPGPLPKPFAEAVDVLEEALAAARFGVVAWAPDRWLGADPTLTLEAVGDLILALNAERRAAGLALGGSDGAATAAAVSTWRTGFPLRMRCERGRVDYDPQRYDWRRLIERGETDLVIWIDAFNAARLPECGAIPAILVGGRPGDAARADVALPVGMPGVTHDAQLVRGDNVVSLTLRAPKSHRDPALLSVAQILERMVEDGGRAAGAAR